MIKKLKLIWQILKSNIFVICHTVKQDKIPIYSENSDRGLNVNGSISYSCSYNYDINIAAEITKEKAFSVFCHELGHAIDCQTNIFSYHNFSVFRKELFAEGFSYLCNGYNVDYALRAAISYAENYGKNDSEIENVKALLKYFELEKYTIERIVKDANNYSKNRK